MAISRAFPMASPSRSDVNSPSGDSGRRRNAATQRVRIMFKLDALTAVPLKYNAAV
jgi:hypothetical protein